MAVAAPDDGVAGRRPGEGERRRGRLRRPFFREGSAERGRRRLARRRRRTAPTRPRTARSARTAMSPSPTPFPGCRSFSARSSPRPPTPQAPGSSRKAGFSFVGETPNAFLTHLNGVLAPIPALTDAAAGLGFLNWLPDNDRVVRTVPLLLDINGQIQPSLAMETLRVAQGASGFVVKSTDAYGASCGQEHDGSTRSRSATWWSRCRRRRSARLVRQRPTRAARFPPGRSSRPAPISPISPASSSSSAPAPSLLSDIVATPLDPSTPGVEAHAQLVEQILSGVTLAAARLGAGSGTRRGRGALSGAGGAGAVPPDLLDGGSWASRRSPPWAMSAGSRSPSTASCSTRSSRASRPVSSSWRGSGSCTARSASR